MKKALSTIYYTSKKFMAELNRYTATRNALLLALLDYLDNRYIPINELEYE